MTRLLLILAVAGLVLTAPALPQQGRAQARLDDPALGSTPDGFDIFLDGDADLWVAMWLDERDPVNTLDDDVFIAISHNGGVSFDPEIQVTSGASLAIDVDDAYLDVDDGTIYIAYDDDALGSTTPQAILMWSSDLGLSWNSLVLDVDGQNPRVQADGQNVAVVWYNDLSTPRPLKALTSSTGPAGLNPANAVQINWAGDIPGDGYELLVSGGAAYVAYLDDTLLANEDDLYYVSYEFGFGAWSRRLQVNDDVATPFGDVDLFLKIDVTGTVVHFAWNEDDVDPLNASDDVVFYRNYDTVSATFSPELQLSAAPPVDTDFMWMDADGPNVLVVWSDDGGTEEPTVAVSNDGGSSFAVQDLALSAAGGPLISQHHRAFVDGDMMYVIYEDDSLNTASIDEVPGFQFSKDAGATWNGPFYLGLDFELDEDIDTEGFAWFRGQNNLGGIWQTDGGAANPDAIYASGVRFPFVSASYEPVGRVVTLDMDGIPVSRAGDYARWAGSGALGTQVHPENPALTVDLGPCPIYTWSTSFPPIPKTTAFVQPDGTATVAITLPRPAPPGAVLNIQGWLNSGCLTCGERPSDLIRLAFP